MTDSRLSTAELKAIDAHYAHEFLDQEGVRREIVTGQEASLRTRMQWWKEKLLNER